MLVGSAAEGTAFPGGDAADRGSVPIHDRTSRRVRHLWLALGALHTTVEGWAESLALAYHAATWAKQITTVQDDEVERIALDGYEPVPEVAGLADT